MRGNHILSGMCVEFRTIYIGNNIRQRTTTNMYLKSINITNSPIVEGSTIAILGFSL